MSTISYAIDLVTDSTVSSAEFGLTNGTFHWVTGRPGYDGSPTYPTYEAGGDNTNVYYEGIIALDKIGNPSRQIDLTLSGEYGTVSNFSFSLVNYNKFFEFVQANSIYMVGRSITFYTVIDGIFYQTWKGLVGNMPYNETNFTISCIDEYRKIHKPIPPNDIQLTGSNSPGELSIGQAQPVAIGNVAFAKLYLTGSKPVYQTLVKDYYALSYGQIGYQTNAIIPIQNNIITASPVEYNTCAGISVDSTNINLFTNNVSFVKNDMSGMYLTACSGDAAPTGELFYITGNEDSSQIGTYPNGTMTRLHLQGRVASALDFNTLWAYTQPNTSPWVKKDLWWFKVLDIETTLTLSDSSIQKFELDSAGRPYLYTYDDKNKKYDRVDNIITQLDTTTAAVKVLSKDIDEQGNLRYYYGIVPSDIQLYTVAPIYDYKYYANSPTSGGGFRSLMPGSFAYKIGDSINYVGLSTESTKVLRDRDGMTSLQIIFPRNKGIKFEFYIESLFPRDQIGNDFDDLWIGADFAIDAIPWSFYYTLAIETTLLDVYGVPMEPESNNILEYPASSVLFSTTQDIYFGLPDVYYAGKGDPANPHGLHYYTLVDLWNRTDNDENANPVRYRDYMRLGSDYVSKIREGSISPTVRQKFTITSVSGAPLSDTTCIIYEVGYTGLKQIQFADGNLYGRISGGVCSDGSPSSDVYHAFKLLLETYDKIPQALLDYGNLPATRSTWSPVGRQITERKNSYEYLTELCRDSYTAMFPTRDGKRKLTAWRDQTNIDVAFDQTSIIRNSIESYERTNPSQVYNDFICKYGYSGAENNFLRSLVLTKTDQSNFPLSTGTWTTYVAGLDPHLYADASALWAQAHLSYQIINYIRQNPTETQELNWYTDNALFQNTAFTGASTTDPAFRYLVELVNWTSLQKESLQFSIPLTSANIKRELCDKITFSDSFYTDSSARNGWITGLEIDVKKNVINVDALLVPPEMEAQNADVVAINERGVPLNDGYTIDENGTRTDQVDEAL